MPANTHEAIYGYTAFRVPATDGSDLRINLDPSMEVNRGGVYPRGLMVGTAGNVTLIGVDDTTAVTLTNLSAGIWHPICIKAITATTAANLVVGY